MFDISPTIPPSDLNNQLIIFHKLTRTCQWLIQICAEAKYMKCFTNIFGNNKEASAVRQEIYFWSLCIVNVLIQVVQTKVFTEGMLWEVFTNILGKAILCYGLYLFGKGTDKKCKVVHSCNNFLTMKTWPSAFNHN